MSTLKFCVFFLFSALGLAFLQKGMEQYPYFISWDMDLITAIDLLRLQDGHTPLHINHPGLGMYLLLKPLLWVSHQFELVEAWGYAGLAEFKNPMLGVAQIVNWVRSFNPFLSTGMALAFWLAFQNFFGRWGFWLGLLVFLQIIFSPSLWGFHLATNRTEFFSLFYTSLAFLALSTILRVQSSAKEGSERTRYIFYVLLALAFLTKIQVLFIGVALLLFLDIDLSTRINLKSIASKISVSRALVFWGLMILLSFAIPIPRNYATFSSYYLPNVFFILWFLVMGIFYLNFSRRFLMESMSRPRSFVRALMTSPRGFLLAQRQSRSLSGRPLAFFEFAWVVGFMFFTALLLNVNQEGLKSIFYYFKIFFLRLSAYNTVSNSTEFYINNILSNLNYHMAPLIGLAALVILAVYKTRRIPKLLIAVLVLVSLNLVLGTRAGLQDAIWNELFLLITLGLICFKYLDHQLGKGVLFLILIFTLGFRLSQFESRPPFLNLSGTIWYSDSERFAHNVYQEEKNLFLYQNLMNTHFLNLDKDLQRKYLRQAEAVSEVQALAKKTWISPSGKLKNIGILHEAPTLELQDALILGSAKSSEVKLYLEDNRDYWLLASSDHPIDSLCVHSANAIDSNITIYKLKSLESDFQCVIYNKAETQIHLVTASTY